MRINILGGRGVLGNGILQELSGTKHIVKSFGSESFNNNTLRYDNSAIYDCDCFIHAAGVTDEEAFADIYKAMTRATVSTKELIDRCLANDCRYFIYISSIHVYGDMEGIIEENSHTNPKTDYALCHVLTENIFRKMAVGNQVRSLVLRVPTIYGYPFDISNLNRPTLIPYDFPGQVVAKRSIELKSSGQQYRNFASNRKVGQIIANWVESDSNPGLMISNVTGDSTMSVKDFALTCIDEFEKVSRIRAELLIKKGVANIENDKLAIFSVLDADEPFSLLDFVRDYISYLMDKDSLSKHRNEIS